MLRQYVRQQKPNILFRLELLKEIVPRINRVAFSFNPATTPYRDIYLKPFKAAALSLAIEATAAPVHDVSDLEAIFAEEARRINSGVIIMPDGFMNVHRAEVVSLAARYRVCPPSIHGVTSLNSAACCHMETSNAIYFDLLRPMLIAS